MRGCNHTVFGGLIVCIRVMVSGPGQLRFWCVRLVCGLGKPACCQVSASEGFVWP